MGAEGDGSKATAVSLVRAEGQDTLPDEKGRARFPSPGPASIIERCGQPPNSVPTQARTAVSSAGLPV